MPGDRGFDESSLRERLLKSGTGEDAVVSVARWRR